VIVYTYPAIGVAGRRKVLPMMPISELNQKLSNIMRVVVHPKYRTIGLGQKLVHETLQKCGTLYVETTAVMAKYNPFFERAGITKIQETPAPKQALAIRDVLTELGFNVTLLNSEKYVVSKLEFLTCQARNSSTINPTENVTYTTKRCKPQPWKNSQNSSMSQRCHFRLKSISSGALHRNSMPTHTK